MRGPTIRRFLGGEFFFFFLFFSAHWINSYSIRLEQLALLELSNYLYTLLNPPNVYII